MYINYGEHVVNTSKFSAMLRQQKSAIPKPKLIENKIFNMKINKKKKNKKLKKK